jgi:hypothetical protein
VLSWWTGRDHPDTFGMVFKSACGPEVPHFRFEGSGVRFGGLGMGFRFGGLGFRDWGLQFRV